MVPLWAQLGNLAYFPALAFVLTLLLTWAVTAAELYPLRKRRDAHWTERARFAWQPRTTVASFLILMPLIFGGLSALFHGPLSLAPRPTTSALTGIVSAGAVLIVGRRIWQRHRKRTVKMSRYLRGVLVDILLRLPQLVILVVTFLLVPLEVGPWVWIGTGLGASLCLLSSWFGGLPVLRMLKFARPAGTRVQRTVAGVAQDMGIEVRSVWEADWPVSNALAYPHTKELVFTPQIQELLSDDELAAVAAHELGHLSESLSVRFARLTPGIAMGLFLLAIPMTGILGIWGPIALVSLFLCIILVVRRTARRMEARADAIGKTHAKTKLTYAQALQKVYRSSLIPAVLVGRRHTHPHLYDRMLDAGVEPDYPRPKPPPRAPSVVLRLATLPVIAGAMIAAGALPELLRLSHDPELDLARIALRGGSASSLSELGTERHWAGRFEQGFLLHRAAVELVDDAAAPGELALLYAASERCVEALEMATLARARLEEGRNASDRDWMLTELAEALEPCNDSQPANG